MNPLVSVIIPVFNSEETLRATLDSVIAQTYKNIEIILIDDGSTDSSEEIIRKVKGLNIYPILYFYQENKGVSAARNAGIKKATGKYIAFLDSDDLWVPEKIQTQVGLIEKNPTIDLLATNKEKDTFKKFLWTEIKELMPISLNLMLYKNFLLTSTTMFKRSLVEDIGYFDEQMNYSEDMDYFCRFAEYHNCFLYNKSMVSAWNDKPAFGHSGLSANLWQMEKGELRALRKVYQRQSINYFEYLYFCSWSFFKFIRKVLITILR